MGRLTETDRRILAGAIVDITKGDPKSTHWFAQVCVRRPEIFKGKTRKQDVVILADLLKKVVERRGKMKE